MRVLITNTLSLGMAYSRCASASGRLSGRSAAMRRLRGSILICIAIAAPVFPAAIVAAPGDISLISVRLPGQITSMYGSSGARISGDGHFLAFLSTSPDLVPNFTRGDQNLFIHNLQTGTNTVLSISAKPVSPSDAIDSFAIDADGQYVAFTSAASYVVSGDTNAVGDVFVRNLQSGETERVSVSSSGAQGNQASYAPSISVDGRYVAFTSRAANLVPGDTNKADDVFVHDRQTGRTERVSVNTAGTQGNATSFAPAISSDGRFVAFTSRASNLMAGDTNAAADVFVRDRQTGTTERVSLGLGGSLPNGNSGQPAISSDGRHVAFYSDASNLVANDTNAAADIFVRDRQAGTTERMNVNSSGGQTTASSGRLGNPSISADGRFVAFASDATNVVPSDSNTVSDMFVHDRLTGQTMLASVSTGGAQGNGWNFGGTLSADGRYLAFDSYASNLVSGDFNGVPDVFVRDRQSSTLTVASASKVKSTAAGSLAAVNPQDCSDIGGPSMSADGRYVAFLSTAPDLVAGETMFPINDPEQSYPSIFVRDRQTGNTEQMANGAGVNIALSADGSTIAAWDYNCGGSVIVDRITGAADSSTDLLAPPAWSSNGRLLVVDDGTGALSVLDRQTHQIDPVSVSSNGAQANSSSIYPAMSADGRFVVFTSGATNLVANDANGVSDVFLRDRQSGTTARVSVASNGQEANGGSLTATFSLSGDGRYVAFSSGATNLVSSDSNGAADVFVKDQQTGRTELVSVNSSGVEGNSDSALYSLSPDGRFVVFSSSATNLAPSYTGKYFIHDRQTGVTQGLFPDANTEQAMAEPDFSINANQQFIAFASDSSLVKADLNQSGLALGSGIHPNVSLARDIYVVERGVTTSALAVSPKSLAFGKHAIRTLSAPQSVTIHNTGATAVPITSIAITGSNAGQFSFTQNCGTSLAGNASCTVKVKFKPTTKGAKSASLNVNGGGGGLRTVTLTGTGT